MDRMYNGEYSKEGTPPGTDIKPWTLFHDYVVARQNRLAPKAKEYEEAIKSLPGWNMSSIFAFDDKDWGTMEEWDSFYDIGP